MTGLEITHEGHMWFLWLPCKGSRVLMGRFHRRDHAEGCRESLRGMSEEELLNLDWRE